MRAEIERIPLLVSSQPHDHLLSVFLVGHLPNDTQYEKALSFYIESCASNALYRVSLKNIDGLCCNKMQNAMLSKCVSMKCS